MTDTLSILDGGGIGTNDNITFAYDILLSELKTIPLVWSETSTTLILTILELIAWSHAVEDMTNTTFAERYREYAQLLSHTRTTELNDLEAAKDAAIEAILSAFHIDAEEIDPENAIRSGDLIPDC